MTPTPQVSELLAVKIELFTFKLQELQTIGKEFVREQAGLIEEARKAVGAPAGHLYNQETRTFHAPVLPATPRPGRRGKP